MRYNLKILSYFINYIVELFPKYLESIYVNRNSIFINVSKENVGVLITVLRYHLGFRFDSLLDVWAVDRPAVRERFKVGYNFLSVFYNFRVIVYTTIAKDHFLDSMTPLFRSANWLEREVWDMFGIFFVNHPDLRRILTDYGFTGFPLRKDFPLSGYTQVRYDEESKKVLLEPLELSQEFRYFNFSSPWEVQDHS
jgi:NADH dehydrogenase (ubiquinone) Fe-S protein 3